MEAVPLPVISAGVGSERFREKALAFLREHMEHPALHKVCWNEPLTEADLRELERLFVESGMASVEQLRETARQDGGLGLFIRSLVGLDRAAAKRALSGFMDRRPLTAAQLDFVNLVIDHLTQCGWMRPEQLYASPFTDEFAEGPNAVFGDEASLDSLLSVIRSVRDNAWPQA